MLFAFFQYFTWIISNILGRMFLHLRVFGLENIKDLGQGGVMFIANHHGNFDPFLIGAALPRSHYQRIKCFRYLTYYKYITRKWYGLFIWLSGAYSLRKKQGSIGKMLSRTIRLLKNNQDILSFPTAKKAKNFTAADARPGVGYLARKINPIFVPVYISGTYNIKVGEFFGRRRKVTIKFGRPFRVSEGDGPKKSDQEVAVKIMAKVCELRDKF